MAEARSENEVARFSQLILLTEENIIVESPGREDLASIRRRLNDGESPAAVLGGNAEVIPYPAITKISADKQAESVDIEYNPVAGPGEELPDNLTPSKREQVFAALKAGFGGRFDAQESTGKSRSPLGALLASTIFSGLTWIGCAPGDQVEGSRRLRIRRRELTYAGNRNVVA